MPAWGWCRDSAADACYEAADGRNPLAGLSALKTFVANRPLGNKPTEPENSMHAVIKVTVRRGTH
jgi:hypothetical protein